jgi:hypothetical protein
MRLANDATFVRAAFSNRLSIFIQDTAAVSVALLIGMLLGWKVALVALATLPVLVVSAIAQVIQSEGLLVYYHLKALMAYFDMLTEVVVSVVCTFYAESLRLENP